MTEEEYYNSIKLPAWMQRDSANNNKAELVSQEQEDSMPLTEEEYYNSIELPKWLQKDEKQVEQEYYDSIQPPAWMQKEPTEEIVATEPSAPETPLNLNDINYSEGLRTASASFGAPVGLSINQDTFASVNDFINKLFTKKRTIPKPTSTIPTNTTAAMGFNTADIEYTKEDIPLIADAFNSGADYVQDAVVKTPSGVAAALQTMAAAGVGSVGDIGDALIKATVNSVKNMVLYSPEVQSMRPNMPEEYAKFEADVNRIADSVLNKIAWPKGFYAAEAYPKKLGEITEIDSEKILGDFGNSFYKILGESASLAGLAKLAITKGIAKVGSVLDKALVPRTTADLAGEVAASAAIAKAEPIIKEEIEQGNISPLLGFGVNVGSGLIAGVSGNILGDRIGNIIKQPVPATSLQYLENLPVAPKEVLARTPEGEIIKNSLQAFAEQVENNQGFVAISKRPLQNISLLGNRMPESVIGELAPQIKPKQLQQAFKNMEQKIDWQVPEPIAKLERVVEETLALGYSTEEVKELIAPIFRRAFPSEKGAQARLDEYLTRAEKRLYPDDTARQANELWGAVSGFKPVDTIKVGNASMSRKDVVNYFVATKELDLLQKDPTLSATVIDSVMSMYDTTNKSLKSRLSRGYFDIVRTSVFGEDLENAINFLVAGDKPQQFEKMRFAVQNQIDSSLARQATYYVLNKNAVRWKADGTQEITDIPGIVPLYKQAIDAGAKIEDVDNFATTGTLLNNVANNNQKVKDAIYKDGELIAKFTLKVDDAVIPQSQYTIKVGDEVDIDFDKLESFYDKQNVTFIAEKTVKKKKTNKKGEEVEIDIPVKNVIKLASVNKPVAVLKKTYEDLQNTPWGKDFRKGIQNIMAVTRQNLVEADVIDAATAEKWAKNYPDFVPIATETRSGSQTSDTLKSRGGSTQSIAPANETLLQYFQRVNSLILAQRVRKPLVELALTNKGVFSQIFLEDFDKVSAYLNNKGVPASSIELPTDSLRNDLPTFTVNISGKKLTLTPRPNNIAMKYYTNIAKHKKMFMRDSENRIVRALYQGMKGAGDVLRYDVTVLDPVFSVMTSLNSVLFEAPLYSQQSMNFLGLEHITYIAKSLGKMVELGFSSTEAIEQATKNIGATPRSVYAEFDTQQIKRVKSQLQAMEDGWAKKILGFPVKKTKNFLDRISYVAEVAPRIAEYNRIYTANLAKGMEPDAARRSAYISSWQVGGDFTQTGAYTGVAGQTAEFARNSTPFIGAAIVSLDKAIRTAKNNPAETAKILGAMAVVYGGLAEHNWSQRKEDGTSVMSTINQNNLNKAIFITNDGDNFLTLVKPFTLGLLPIAVLNRIPFSEWATNPEKLTDAVAKSIEELISRNIDVGVLWSPQISAASAAIFNENYKGNPISQEPFFGAGVVEDAGISGDAGNAIRSFFRAIKDYTDVSVNPVRVQSTIESIAPNASSIFLPLLDRIVFSAGFGQPSDMWHPDDLSIYRSYISDTDSREQQTVGTEFWGAYTALRQAYGAPPASNERKAYERNPTQENRQRLIEAENDQDYYRGHLMYKEMQEYADEMKARINAVEQQRAKLTGSKQPFLGSQAMRNEVALMKQENMETAYKALSVLQAEEELYNNLGIKYDSTTVPFVKDMYKFLKTNIDKMLE